MGLLGNVRKPSPEEKFLLELLGDNAIFPKDNALMDYIGDEPVPEPAVVPATSPAATAPEDGTVVAIQAKDKLSAG